MNTHTLVYFYSIPYSEHQMFINLQLKFVPDKFPPVEWDRGGNVKWIKWLWIRIRFIYSNKVVLSITHSSKDNFEQTRSKMQGLQHLYIQNDIVHFYKQLIRISWEEPNETLSTASHQKIKTRRNINLHNIKWKLLFLNVFYSKWLVKMKKIIKIKNNAL